MNIKNITLLLLFLSGIATIEAAPLLLTLDSCRSMAIDNNKELRMADSKQRAAYYERKAAFTKYFPRVSATGAYMHTSKEISLLSNDQKETLNNLGTTVGSLSPALAGMTDALNGVGSSLVDALHTDTRDMGGVGVMLTQPVYMGGKIRAYNRITGYAEQLASSQHDMTLQDVIVEVDEAYWRIISLNSRKKLAVGYFNLVSQLDKDIEKMINEGFATKADGLSVKVKVNEARVSLIQVDNGLDISRMLLCQLCGLDINTPIVLADEKEDAELTDPSPISADIETALARRPELNMLSLATRIADEKTRLARSEFLPTVALTGGYLATNPNVFNSFERRMKGMWNVGVVVNIPLVTSGERFYKVKAARAEADAARFRLDETREKVELQVNQNRQRVQEAAERLSTAHSSCAESDENLRYAQLGLQEGVIPVSNVLEAQTAWLKAHSERVSAQIDLRLANVYLLRSTGSINVK